MRMIQYKDVWFFLDEYQTLWELRPFGSRELPFEIIKRAILNHDEHLKLMNAGRIEAQFIIQQTCPD